MCITDSHDMTIAVQVALNPNTTTFVSLFLECFQKLPRAEV